MPPDGLRDEEPPWAEPPPFLDDEPPPWIDDELPYDAEPLLAAGVPALNDALPFDSLAEPARIAPVGDPAAALQRFFGYSQFRPLQREAVQHVSSGGDAIILMPTGGGKSLCYQLPTMMNDGYTLVVSPLIALMHDQVQALNANGIPAAYLNSSLAPMQQSRVVDEVQRGQRKLLYAAPERVNTQRFGELLRTHPPRMIAIDEAHCISQWGHEFRPDYRELRRLTEAHPGIPAMALTATATPAVANDIVDQLARPAMKMFRGSFDRPNLTFRVLPKQRAAARLVALLRDDPAASTIVYCFSRKDTEEYAGLLGEAGMNAAAYHAGMNADHRRETQDQFIRDEVPIICATIAFGMGIDKPDVRRVVHMDMPKSIESYYQEVGRAGRDGDPAECVMFFTQGASHKQKYFINQLTDEDEKSRALKRLGMMVSYGQMRGCRRSVLLRYFGDAAPEGNCGACDNCLGDREARMPRISPTLPSAAGRSEMPRSDIPRPQRAAYDPDAPPDEAEQQRFERLREARAELARRGGVPAYIVAHNAALRAMARANPRTKDDLIAVDGFGPAKVERYGADLLAAIAERVEPAAPAAPAAEASGWSPWQERQFEALMAARRDIAEADDISPGQVVGPRALREMVREQPKSIAELERVKRLPPEVIVRYGEHLLQALNAVQADETTAPRLPFQPSAPSSEGTREASADLHDEGFSIQAIAQARGLEAGTIIGHLEDLAQQGRRFDLAADLPNPQRLAMLEAAFDQLGDQELVPIYEALNAKFSYAEIRVARLHRRQLGGAALPARRDEQGPQRTLL